MAGKGSKLIFIARYLYENTDINNPIPFNQMLEICRNAGFHISSNTLRWDIQSLMDSSIDVVEIRRKQAFYYLRGRMFTFAEIRIMIDAVASAQFINKELTDHLIDRLKKIAGNHVTDRLFPGVPIPKTACTEILHNVDVITRAIKDGKKISFRYYSYSPDGQRVYRHDGEFYTFSPYELACNDNRYYVIGWHERRAGISSFRVDLITEAKLLDDPAVEAPDAYDPGAFGSSIFRMFPGDKECDVTLECPNELMLSIIDRFGVPSCTTDLKNGSFRVNVRVSVSGTFFGWLAQYGGRIKICAPLDVKQDCAEFFKKLYEAHE